MNKDFLNKLLSELNADKNNSKNAKVLVVDAMNTFLRSFAIIQHLNPNGHHVGGLVGFLKSVGYAIKLYQPSRVVLVFDGQGNSTNKKYLYADYKANRTNIKVTNWKVFGDKKEESESMANQMGRLIEYCTQLPVSMISIPKIEADDVMGYLVQKFEADSEVDEVTIMSADKDFLQLVSKKTSIYSPTKKKTYRPEDVLEEYQIHSHNFINYNKYRAKENLFYTDEKTSLNRIVSYKLSSYSLFLKSKLFEFINYYTNFIQLRGEKKFLHYFEYKVFKEPFFNKEFNTNDIIDYIIGLKILSKLVYYKK